MKHLFVPYELAKQLKEKGFNEPCLGPHFDSKGKFFDSAFRKDENGNLKSCLHFSDTLFVPIYQQVVDWFRSEYNISIGEYPSKKHIGFFIMNNNSKAPMIKVNGPISGGYYGTFQQAIEDALKFI